MLNVLLVNGKMFKKNKEPYLKFINLYPNQLNSQELAPTPYKKNLPYWWNDMPSINNNVQTIKECPSFPDLFSHGYVIPMWTDIILQYDEEKEQIKTSKKIDDVFPFWEGHSVDQFPIISDLKIGDRDIEGISKITCPWSIITPKGYSTMIMPLFYNFTQDWTVLPGIIDTDIFHQINCPMLLHAKKEEITFKKGIPLFAVFPFKRTKYNYSIIENNQAIYEYLKEKVEILENLRPDGKPYRKMQRERGY